jgi:uncharacterized protein
MIYLGYIAAVLIGVSLGMIGGGGSILTIPVLVYLMGIAPTVATSYSLFIVGAGALAGTFRSYKEISIRTALIFGSASIVSVLITRNFVFPLIPHHLFNIGNTEITKETFLMLLFGMLMVAASYSMIKAGKKKIGESSKRRNIFFLLVLGLIIGCVTGLLGAGGGFLIIPSLVLFNKLQMKSAVATSLTIIATNSLIGFFGSAHLTDMNWSLLLIMTGIVIAGIFIGTSLSRRVSGKSLKIGFGWFVLCMGIFILIREVIAAS